jgi:hypothetical protein
MGGVGAHDRIVALRASEAGFLTIVGAEVVVVVDAIGQRETRANCRSIEPTGEVHPFATVAGPRLAAVGDGSAGGN